MAVLMTCEKEGLPVIINDKTNKLKVKINHFLEILLSKLSFGAFCSSSNCKIVHFENILSSLKIEYGSLFINSLGKNPFSLINKYSKILINWVR